LVEVRRALEADCRRYVEIHCPEARDMRKEERLRHCGWWADYEACTFYLRLYRRLGGEVFTALIDDGVVGEVELLPHDDCLLGPRGYINVLWVKESMRGRGVGKSLVKTAVRWAGEMGYGHIDVIPEEGSEGFYFKLGFQCLTQQVKALKEPSSAPANIPCPFEELSSGEAPVGMKLIAGTYRPGLFTWHTAWEDPYLPPRLPPQAYRLTIGGLTFKILLDYYVEDKASLAMWCSEAPSLASFKEAIIASEALASRANVKTLFVQVWEQYWAALDDLKYRAVGKVMWLSKEVG